MKHNKLNQEKQLLQSATTVELTDTELSNVSGGGFLGDIFSIGDSIFNGGKSKSNSASGSTGYNWSGTFNPTSTFSPQQRGDVSTGFSTGFGQQGYYGNNVTSAAESGNKLISLPTNINVGDGGGSAQQADTPSS